MRLRIRKWIASFFTLSKRKGLPNLCTHKSPGAATGCAGGCGASSGDAFEVVEAEVVERKTAGDHARRHLAQHRRIGRCQSLQPGRQVRETIIDNLEFIC